ncbi:MAG TPA: secretin N-terminal domain-containing protein, partial [Phycisphaerae bacterium]|nr:secretin N-terminal domain-containing protein [Phycisphaerae bacterium]
PGIDIRIFQLKKLNAAEVEQALKAILKIDQRDRRRMPRMMTGGAVPGMPGSWMGQTALIEQLQEQMLELQTAGEGKLAINPSEQITITSDATTNSVIVSAPDDGMKLVEKLINKLEEQEIPLMVKTIKLENADVGDIMPQLEKLFERGGGGGGGGRPGAGGENVTPSRLGAVSIAADARTNQLIIRALAPDFEKILPVIQNLDQKLDGQVVQTFTLQHADAASIEQALSKTYISTTGGKGTGSPIRMAADTSTNTLFVWADASKRAEIAAQVMELDKKAQEKGETKKIALTQANAQVVAEKLNAAFGTRTGRGRSEVKITGDSASGVLFVTAPPEIFKQIEEAAKAMDTQKLLQIKSFTLKNAYATEVLEQMKDMTMQLSGQLRGRTDMQLDVFAATADARTNTIFVTGAAATIAIAETVIKQIDVAPSTPTAQITQYFTLTKADAASVAQTINNLYVNVPGKAVPPPKAYAEPVTNSVFVYATQPQIDQIKATVIDPLEKAAPEAGQDIQMYRIALKYAKADDVLQTMTQYVNQRRAALAQAGVQRNMRPQDLAISLTADTNTNQLILSCNKKNYEEIKALIDTIDVEQTSAMARQTKIYPLRYADVSSASQAINQALSKPGTVGEKDRVTVVPEYGTQSVVVTASP